MQATPRINWSPVGIAQILIMIKPGVVQIAPNTWRNRPRLARIRPGAVQIPPEIAETTVKISLQVDTISRFWSANLSTSIYYNLSSFLYK
jgi:hypothetical protein